MRIAVAVVCLLAGMATSAQAATVTLHAAPAAGGAGNCSTPADACTIIEAVTKANATPVTESVRIALADGLYLLSAPTPTALPVTFAGPKLAFFAESGRPTLNGTHTVRLMSIATASNVSIDGITFEAANVAGNGGAIENNGTLLVRNSTFTENTGSNGGAIANVAGATLRVESSTFSHNKTTSVGGGAIIAYGPATIERSTMDGNTAPINGGAINVQGGGTVTVSTSTFVGNTSGGLGGALSSLGALTVEASTIAGNSGTNGAAIANANPAKTIFAADIIGPQTSGNACNAAIFDAGFNLDFDGTCISPTSPAPGSHNGHSAYGSSTYGAVLDAYLADDLADYGGPTPTLALLGTPNPPTDLADPAFATVPADFELLTPIDGVSTACGLADQRGQPRIAPCDVGAFELPPTPPTPAPPGGPPAPGPSPKPATKATISALKVSPKKLHDGQKATISFNLNVAAKVTFQLKRKVKKNGKVKFVKSAGAPKAFSAAAGSVKRTWKPKGLPPGTYQLRATPAGGAPSSVAFKIVAGGG